MRNPIVGIAGEAGRGKDAVASIIQKISPSTQSIAQADPMKRFCAMVFGFTEEQLWGPSHCRNAVDERFADVVPWVKADETIGTYGLAWISTILGVEDRTSPKVQGAYRKLYEWFAMLKATYGPRGRVVQDLSIFPDGNEPPTTRQGVSPRIVLQLLGTEWGRHVSKSVWADYAISTARQLLNGESYYDRQLGMVPHKQYGYVKVPELVLVTDVRFPNEVSGLAAINAHRLLVTGPVTTGLQAGVKGHTSESLLSQIPRHWFTAELYNDKAHGMASLEASVERYYRSITQVERFGSSAGHNLP